MRILLLTLIQDGYRDVRCSPPIVACVNVGISKGYTVCFFETQFVSVSLNLQQIFDNTKTNIKDLLYLEVLRL